MANTTKLVDEKANVATADGAQEPDVATDSSSKTWVTFDTDSSLVAADNQTDSDVYVRDMSGTTQTLVSRADGAAGAVGSGDSDEPSISDDGNVIAFQSAAGNLLDGDADTTFDIHVRNVSGGSTTLVSRDDGVSGVKSNDNSFNPAISGDGTAVAFESIASNFARGRRPASRRSTCATSAATRPHWRAGRAAPRAPPAIPTRSRLRSTTTRACSPTRAPRPTSTRRPAATSRRSCGAFAAARSRRRSSRARPAPARANPA